MKILVKQNKTDPVIYSKPFPPLNLSKKQSKRDHVGPMRLCTPGKEEVADPN